MNIKSLPWKSLLAVVLLGHASALSLRGAERLDPATEDFAGIATNVVLLLQSGDATAFASAMTPSLADWRTVVKTNRDAVGEDPLGSAWQKSLDYQRQQMESAARQLLAQAAVLKVDFSSVQLTATAVAPKSLGTSRYNSIQAEGEGLPWAEKIDVIVAAQPRTNEAAAERLQGEYKLAVMHLLKFPTGWRAAEGVRWVSFPTTVADAKVQNEMAILDKVAARKGIDQTDDPALGQLGETIARFIRSADLRVYESDVMLSVDAVWSMMQNMGAVHGQKLPPREELDKQWAIQRKVLLEPTQALLELMRANGIELQEAEIAVGDVSVKRLTARGGAGSIESLEGDQLEVQLKVKSGRKSKAGQNLSGVYTVAAEEAMRIDNRWYVSRALRWAGLPPGVVDKTTIKDLEFESYVAEHGNLPPGTLAPDVEFITINGAQKGQLKDLRGKVVILDFWATWCGPCQEPMAKMQKYRAENPTWGERVAVVSLSIDDTLKTVRNHLDKRGWTNSFNVWAGEGGWQSAAAKAFRVRGVPTCYVIDAEGKIVQAGHPESLRAPEVVNRLLK